MPRAFRSRATVTVSRSGPTVPNPESKDARDVQDHHAVRGRGRVSEVEGGATLAEARSKLCVMVRREQNVRRRVHEADIYHGDQRCMTVPVDYLVRRAKLRRPLGRSWPTIWPPRA
jgi:hypothetical protein